MQKLPGEFDFVWMHPPYWNIIEYRSGDNDLSNQAEYERFQKMLMACLKQCYDALADGGRLAVLVADVRRKGQYTPLIREILNFPYGEVRSIIIKVQHNCASDRKRYGRMEDVPSHALNPRRPEGHCIEVMKYIQYVCILFFVTSGQGKVVMRHIIYISFVDNGLCFWWCQGGGGALYLGIRRH